MVRRVTPSQWNSMVRQTQQKQRQAIDKYNRDVRAYNQKLDQAVNRYNQEVRSHNARVRADRQRLKNEITRLGRQPTTTRYVTYRVSVAAVQTAYERLERSADAGSFDPSYDEFLDLSEREAANSAGMMNALLSDENAASDVVPNALESPVTPILREISGDLGERWRGALYSLSPDNPDAARHFCTSAREVIVQILEARAPDDAVVALMPDCDRTPQGTPTRRARIRYFLHLKGMDDDDLEEFVESDMNNVVELFRVFNDGTHGSAGTFDLAQLQAIRRRVEDGIMFLSRLVH